MPKQATFGSPNDLPQAGEGRWWNVSHNPKSRTNPITIQLMESMTPGRQSLSRVIGFEYTTASWKALSAAADLVLARVGDYDKVVGAYQVEER